MFGVSIISILITLTLLSAKCALTVLAYNAMHTDECIATR